MSIKKIIPLVFLFSYAGAIAHNIIPHHHHDNQQEAKEHHHHNHHDSDHHHGHSHDSDDTNERNQHAHDVYFLTHAVNGDVMINHLSIDNPTKTKSVAWDVENQEAFVYEAFAGVVSVFHPPADDWIFKQSYSAHRLLRAPPFFIA